MTRKQSRAAAAAAATATTTTADTPSANLTSAADIPMSHPSITRAEGKTLLEIAAERQAQLSPHGQAFFNSKSNNNATSTSTQFLTISPNGELKEEPGHSPTDTRRHNNNNNNEAITTTTTPREEPPPPPPAISPILDTIFLALPLSSLHFTLSFLTAHQYAQELRVRPIVLDTVFVAFPTLTLVIHLLHGHLFFFSTSTRSTLSSTVQKALTVAQQILFLLAANVAGCYLIHLTNDRGYYAVMKKAPSIGTIWVWSIIELGLLGALAGVAGPGLYAWWNGYGIW